MSVRVIFLGGLGRSGTTLLERLLGELPGVVPLGEVVHLWARGVGDDEPCGCGARFSECPFWREVGERAFGGWSPELAARVLDLRARVDRTRRIPALSLRALAGPPLATSALTEYGAAYRRLYQAAGEAAGGPVVIDSSKHVSLAFCLSATTDLSVVHVVRDPRAVAHSWGRRVPRPENGEPMTRWRPALVAVHWMAQNLLFHLLALRGVAVVRVRYEDLVDAPRATLARLAERLRLGADLTFLRRGEATLSSAHTVSGNPMRFAVGPLALLRDDAWRTRLPRRHRWLVTALTWPLSIPYGYRLGVEVSR